MSKPDKKAANQKPGKIVLLPVEQIEPSPFQARTAFDETEIAALAVSILQNGLLQPISVRKTGYHKYQLVAGERRLRACRLAKLERIPAIIQDFDDSETAALGLLENLQRAQLDAFDAARGSREVIRQGCEMLGMELSEVVALCIQGMQTVAGELGLGAKQLE